MTGAPPGGYRPAALARYLAGELAPPLALMHLLIEMPDVEAAMSALDEAAQAEPAAACRARLGELARLLGEHRPGAQRVADMLRQGIEHGPARGTPAEALAACRTLFDRLARQSPEASVALYSLGSPELLAALTAEVIERLADWGLIAPDRRVLDLGCGIGRFAAALAPRVASVTGIDLSPAMIDLARARCAGFRNVRLLVGSGRGFPEVGDAGTDLLLAVDSFPYIVQAGAELVDCHLAEAARVLRPGGDLAIFNFSYGGDLDADRRDVAARAAASGFRVVRDGTRDLTLWDGATFHLVRAVP
jgi:SAM-dependent methyltransferase